MIFWILNSIFWAIWDIVYKKSLIESEWKITSKYYQFIWYFFMSIVLIIWLILFELQKINFNIFIIIFISSIFWLFSELFEVYAYKNEKISILVPYWEFQSIFTIVFWFFIFSDNSLISFISAVLAWLTLVFSAIDFKKFKFNKYCIAMIISALLWSIKYILYSYLILNLTEFSIVFYTTIILTILLFLNIFKNKEISQYKKINKKLFSLILSENIIRLVVWIITLILIKDLWLVQAILIWMLYLITSLILSFIVLKDKPSKKDIIVVSFVFIFITYWTIFG